MSSIKNSQDSVVDFGDGQDLSENTAKANATTTRFGPSNGYCGQCNQGEKSGVLFVRSRGDGFFEEIVCFDCWERFVRQMKFVHAPDYLH